jgi:hypothetical protein
MVDRVAGLEVAAEGAPGGPKDPVEVIDEAVDAILSALEAIGAAIPQVDADTPAEKAALQKIQDTIETAVAPYMVDVVKAMDVFVGEEE